MKIEMKYLYQSQDFITSLIKRDYPYLSLRRTSATPVWAFQIVNLEEEQYKTNIRMKPERQKMNDKETVLLYPKFQYVIIILVKVQNFTTFEVLQSLLAKLLFIVTVAVIKTATLHCQTHFFILHLNTKLSSFKNICKKTLFRWRWILGTM